MGGQSARNFGCGIAFGIKPCRVMPFCDARESWFDLSRSCAR